MWFSHFHTLGRNIPLSLFEVDLLPFRVPEFTRANENQRRKSQSATNNNAAVIGIQSAKQRTDSFRISYSRQMLLFGHWLQSAAQVGSGVPHGTASGNRVTEYLPTCLHNAM